MKNNRKTFLKEFRVSRKRKNKIHETLFDTTGIAYFVVNVYRDLDPHEFFSDIVSLLAYLFYDFDENEKSFGSEIFVFFCLRISTSQSKIR